MLYLYLTLFRFDIIDFLSFASYIYRGRPLTLSAEYLGGICVIVPISTSK